MSFTLLRWNGKFDDSSEFVVRNNKTGEQAYFEPNGNEKVNWVDKDLTSDSKASSWEDFDNETVEDLDAVVF